MFPAWKIIGSTSQNKVNENIGSKQAERRMIGKSQRERPKTWKTNRLNSKYFREIYREQCIGICYPFMPKVKKAKRLNESLHYQCGLKVLNAFLKKKPNKQNQKRRLSFFSSVHSFTLDWFFSLLSEVGHSFDVRNCDLNVANAIRTRNVLNQSGKFQEGVRNFPR